MSAGFAQGFVRVMEGVLAAFAQFDNDCRSDRTRKHVVSSG
jgi:hypothetical protein